MQVFRNLSTYLYLALISKEICSMYIIEVVIWDLGVDAPNFHWLVQHSRQFWHLISKKHFDPIDVKYCKKKSFVLQKFLYFKAKSF